MLAATVARIVGYIGGRQERREEERIAGINTPEVRSKNESEKQKAFAAKKRLEELFVTKDLIIHSKGFDKYGRCIAEVITSDVNVGQVLINEGYAKKFESNY